jgi:cyclopropane-fatty-acyl-phospholipid synthase
MFEHMKNYQSLLREISHLLKQDGKLFVHIFSSIHYPHEYDAGNPRDWMAQTFFTAGLMPTDDLLLHFQDDLILENHWRINGKHYTKTLNAWNAKMNLQKKEILPVLSRTYGDKNLTKWWVNWKLFFLGCAETWNLDRGREYIVSHYLFSRRTGA